MASESEHVVKVRAEWDNAVMARPGDTLVVGLSADITYADGELDDLEADFATQLPGIKVVLVQGATAFAVYRPAGQ